MDKVSTTNCPNCDHSQKRVAELEAKVAQMAETIKKLSAELEKKKNPQKPGRKSGNHHGKHGHRPSPPPDTIDENYDAPLPQECANCGSNDITELEVVPQYQTEIPVKPIIRQFDVHVGQCQCCGARVQGRHPLQTSDALGAAASQLGANAHAALNILNKEMGLSHGKCAKVFARLFGINIVRGTSARSMLRSGKRCEAAYGQIKEVARASPYNVPDETGWRIGGENAWLHVVVNATVTCYMIVKGRGHQVLAAILGLDYAGKLIRDGWRAYDLFKFALHQLCLAHLLRRCEELLESARGGAVRFPRAVKAILQTALQLRDRYEAGEISEHGLAVMRGRLYAKMRCLVRPVKTHNGNKRFAAHLEKHLDDLFTFLFYPGLDATNWRAEQAIRPAVVNRKVWGGNRTDNGAKAVGYSNVPSE
jgi:transposase